MDDTPVDAVLETSVEPSASEIVVDETVPATVSAAAAVTQERLSESPGKGSPVDDEVRFDRPQFMRRAQLESPLGRGV